MAFRHPISTPWGPTPNIILTVTPRTETLQASQKHNLLRSCLLTKKKRHRSQTRSEGACARCHGRSERVPRFPRRAARPRTCKRPRSDDDDDDDDDDDTHRTERLSSTLSGAEVETPWPRHETNCCEERERERMYHCGTCKKGLNIRCPCAANYVVYPLDARSSSMKKREVMHVLGEFTNQYCPRFEWLLKSMWKGKHKMPSRTVCTEYHVFHRVAPG